MTKSYVVSYYVKSQCNNSLSLCLSNVYRSFRFLCPRPGPAFLDFFRFLPAVFFGAPGGGGGAIFLGDSIFFFPDRLPPLAVDFNGLFYHGLIILGSKHTFVRRLNL